MKRIVFILLALALILGSVSLISATPQQEETGPIKVGMYQDLSAGTAQWGTDSEKGARLRIKEINEAGGIMGRQVELVIYDCKLTLKRDLVYAMLAKTLANLAFLVPQPWGWPSAPQDMGFGHALCSS